MTANGNWTLFFVDVTSSDEHSTITGYSISVEVVPEPVTVAMGTFAAILAGLKLISLMRRKQRVCPVRVNRN